MTIQVGDQEFAATLKYLSPEGPKEISTDELFGEKVAIFAVPGLLEPPQRHLPVRRPRCRYQGKGVVRSPVWQSAHS